MHEVGRKLHLVRGTHDTIRLGVALGITTWLIGVLLALFEGAGERVFSIMFIGAHVRLLVVIPLLFLCESMVDPRFATFADAAVSAELIPESEIPRLQAGIRRLQRWRNAWLPEVVCLAAAIAMSVEAGQLHLLGATAVYDPDRPLLVGLWYWGICLPLFRFLCFRWIWRLVLWWLLLWRFSKLHLQLNPTHPDRAGGLGYLEVVHAEFASLVFAISATLASAFAESMVAGKLDSDAIYPSLVLILVADAALFLGPLCFFTPKLWLCRITGLYAYTEFASRYVRAFDRKWLAGVGAAEKDLLGSQDIQALADLSNSMDVVNSMRLVPASRRLLFIFGAAAVAPMLPLLLLKYPVAELAKKLFGMFAVF